VDRPTISPEHMQEAAENLTTIRDFIRFGVTALPETMHNNLTFQHLAKNHHSTIAYA
jgi:hypothetical protein